MLSRSSAATPLLLLALISSTALADSRRVAPAKVESGATLRVATFATTLTSSSGTPDVVFDTTTSPLPPNVASLGFEANAVAEIGDLIQLNGSPGYLDSAIITMSSWAIRSDYPGAAAGGFVHPITLKLYAVDRTGATPKVGAVLATLTQNVNVPWRPEPDPTSTSPLRPWRASDGNLYTGLAFNISFDLSALSSALPAEFVYGVSFDTAHYGASPRVVRGPYDSLNLGFSDQPPSIGTDDEADVVFWSTTADHYTDGGAAGSGIFRRDTGWAPYKPSVQFIAAARGSLVSALAGLTAPPPAAARLAPVSTTTASTKIDAALKSATTYLGAALAPRLWRGGNRPAGEDAGETIFELLADASRSLQTVAASTATTAGAASRALDGELAASARLAATAIADATVAGAKATQLKEAINALASANGFAGRGQTTQAITAFGRAWESAREAATESRHD